MRIVLVGLCVVAVVTGCVPVQSNSTPAGTATVTAVDTMSGVVSVVGADPGTWLALQPRGGGASLRLDGAGTDGLRNTSGAEIWVSGMRQADAFRVDEFEVRRVNGQAVDDGIISVEAGKVMVRMRSGTQREVLNASTALRNMPGARVWISPAVADRAPSYGVIRRP